MARRKVTERNDAPAPMDEERMSRFVWGPGDVIITKKEDREKARAKAKAEPQPCQDGCGAMTRGGAFLPGHDARHKGRLLQAARSGDAAARAELLERGWATDESIDNATAKPSEAERVERKRAKLGAKAERLRAELAAVEAQLAAQD